MSEKHAAARVLPRAKIMGRRLFQRLHKYRCWGSTAMQMRFEIWIVEFFCMKSMY
jgi:hypothetical protein